MRAFVIVDASKRKSKPAAALFYEEKRGRKRERFTLEIASRCTEEDLPLSLSFCAQREFGRASAKESEAWVRSRIATEDWRAAGEELEPNAATKLDVLELFADSKGRSSDDDYLAYEVALPLSMADELAELLAKEAEYDPHDIDFETAADRLINSVVRQRKASRIHYALVKLPGDNPKADGATGRKGFAFERNADGEADDQTGFSREWAFEFSQRSTAAQRIAAQIRERRLSAGLTQKQLAARAGITQTVMSRLESGRGNPTLSLLEELAGALDCELVVALEEGAFL